MAIVKKGSMLEGLRGRVGDLIFREVGGRTVVSRRPTQRREEVRSPQRQRALTRFQQAVHFAREARHRQSYRSLSRVLRARSPYHVALQDFLSDPVIEGVDGEAVGPRGGELVIRVSERIAVRSVRVKMAGRAIREGSGPTPKAAPDAPPLGPAASPSEPSEASDPSDPSEPPKPPDPGEERGPEARRLQPIPAAVFFRHVGRGEGANAETRGRAPLPRPAGSEADDGADETTEIAPVELHATRHLGIQRRPETDRGRSTKEIHTEVWRVTLPRPGRVEVIASDYAGNRAHAVVRVGLPGAEQE